MITGWHASPLESGGFLYNLSRGESALGGSFFMSGGGKKTNVPIARMQEIHRHPDVSFSSDRPDR